MKYIKLLLILLLFGCKNDPLKEVNNIAKETSNSLNEGIPLETLKEITMHYQNESEEYNASLKVSKNDTIYNLSYYNIPTEEDIYDGILISINIPLKANVNLYQSNSILLGDLNNDNIEELVVSVHTEGGWGGGNNWMQEFFVFQKINNEYKKLFVIHEYELVDCSLGSFRLKNILNNSFVGETSCYKDGDPRCCPSIHNKKVVKLLDRFK